METKPTLQIKALWIKRTYIYGTAPSSFLATRCLYQLAVENKELQLREADIIFIDFYVDDLLPGCFDLDSLITLRKNITAILKQSSFDLHKFSSNNSPALI